MTRTDSRARTAAGPGKRAGRSLGEPWPSPLVWTAAALAAGASLLHWIGADNLSHDVTIEAVLSVAAASALMALAVALAAQPWRSVERRSAVRIARGVFIAGCAVAAAAALGAAIAVLAQPAGGEHVHHAGAAVEGGMRGPAILVVQLALAALLGWLASRADPGSENDGGSRRPGR